MAAGLSGLGISANIFAAGAPNSGEEFAQAYYMSGMIVMVIIIAVLCVVVPIFLAMFFLIVS